jgi:hypothetical protein
LPGAAVRRDADSVPLQRLHNGRSHDSLAEASPSQQGDTLFVVSLCHRGNLFTLCNLVVESQGIDISEETPHGKRSNLKISKAFADLYEPQWFVLCVAALFV